MALLDPRILAPFQHDVDRCRDASGMRSRPECVVLDVAEGVVASSEPPVRVFLGTEPAQYRAERIFIYSIEKVRDPSRIYEIHIMKELAGFERRFWLTGFTNYRYAIPHYAGCTGKAIWNDVDEIYLTDPAELFDLDMNGHGILTVPKLSGGSRPDSSVMLIDCAQMAPIWPLEDTQRRSAKSLLDRSLSVPGLNGSLSPDWNARDAQYVEGQSHLIHYTALHTQPWQPLPKRYVYQRNPVGKVWYDLERAADAEGYSVFTVERPSAQYRALRERVRSACAEQAIRRSPSEKSVDLENIRKLVSLAKAQTLLEIGFAMPTAESAGLKRLAERFGVSSAYAIDFCYAEATLAPPGGFDGVICTEMLEYLPDEDVPWVVEELFARANKFVYATVTDGLHAPDLPDGTSPRHLASGGRSRWYTCFENASARHPDVRWKLVFDRATGRENRIQHLREGGCGFGEDPVVWVLADDDPRHNEASQGLASALGWASETRATDAALAGPPWPDLVIAAGRRPARQAREIGKQSRGRSRVVEILGRGGQRAQPFDLVVTHGHPGLPHDRCRIETIGPLIAMTSERLEAAAAQAPEKFVEAPQPRVLLLTGPSISTHPLDAIFASQMANEVLAFAEAAGGSLFAVTSSETEDDVVHSIRSAVGLAHHAVANADSEDLLLQYLSLADAIVVSDNNPFLLAAAAAVGRPVCVYPVPECTPNLGVRIARWIEMRALAHPTNRRGTPRPQKHIEYFCARLIERGIVKPPPNLDALHQALFDRGAARSFSEFVENWAKVPRSPLRETHEVARILRSMLGGERRDDLHAAN